MQRDLRVTAHLSDNTAAPTDAGAVAAPEVVVVGSLNLDVSVAVAQLPAPGETVLGGDALWSPGGKGANQAVGVSLLGRRVEMIGCVGADEPGQQLLDNLGAGVGHQHVAVLEDVSTGIATIAVDSHGDNQIVVSPGANARVAGAHIDAASVELGSALVVLSQFEIPLASVLAAAKQTNGTFVLNPAPAPRDLDEEGRVLLADLLAEVDIVVPNQGELAALLGEPSAPSLDDVGAQARRLASSGPKVVVTLGEQGAMVVDTEQAVHVPAVVVDAVDATAAGDSFCAAVADALCGGADLVDAVKWAVEVASVTVTRRGAQRSLPTRAEVVRSRR